MFKIEGLKLPEEVKPDTIKKSKKSKKNSEANDPLKAEVKMQDLEPKRRERKRKSQSKPKEEPTVEPGQESNDRKRKHEETAKSNSDSNSNSNSKSSSIAESTAISKPAKQVKLTPLQLKMQAKLSGSRFRWINELLYTTNSQKSLEVFQAQPEVFQEYHSGFRNQVENWPENPILSFVEQFKQRLSKPLNAPGGLPGDKSTGTVTVADMGCGEAALALELDKIRTRRAQFLTHSFDLHKANDRITVADIANVPLEDESCDVVIFCLALMGTNLNDFINEGIRILKNGGLMWIAEIKSRFENNDYTEFIEKLKNLGLYHKTTDDSNKMFVKFEFIKLKHRMDKAKSYNEDIYLKPCIYKRR